MSKILSLQLVFPHGITARQCQEICIWTQTLVDARVSEGGYAPKSDFGVQEGVEFQEDAMIFVFGYKGATP